MTAAEKGGGEVWTFERRERWIFVLRESSEVWVLRRDHLRLWVTFGVADGEVGRAIMARGW